jgi:glutathione synthase/RimK-type ligase-like ATP-grasp enzyme
MDIALVTFAGAPALDPDDEPLAHALAALGIAAAPVPWDDPDCDWSAPRIALLRSTWDYHHRSAEFLAWARAAAARTQLVNPLAVVEWNTHKGHYLEALAARGAPVVPTVLVRAGESIDLPALLQARRWTRAVIKPAISADSFATVRVSAGDPGPGIDHLAAHRGRDMLVQPFLESVEADGERCLVFIGGELSHAVRKRSLFLGGRHAGPEGVPVPPAADEAAAARRILDLAGYGPLSYARVDLTRDAGGTPVLLELELVEPTLFLRSAPGAAERLAALLADALGNRRR